ncbi:hypothetical protein LDENG_00210100 [Lucifuga dentata]|nr:hypothetical protein LDENG_00210100 [Lucifuga dentata]
MEKQVWVWIKMFIEEEDWNDEAEAQVLSKSVFNSSQTVNSSNLKSKGVGKKSLLRTLQTLGSVPDWKSKAHEQGSDSETETEPSHAKRKKKRKKRQKHVETPGEQPEDGEFNCVKEEKNVPKKKKKKDNKYGTPKVKTTDSDKSNDEETKKSAKVEIKITETLRLTRKQWKNKMKNKRKCKNKYYHNKPDEEVNKAESAEKQKSKEEVIINSHSNTSERTASQNPVLEKEHKAQNRKKAEEDIYDKQQIKKQKKAKGRNQAETDEAEPAEPGTKITDDEQQQTPKKKMKLQLSKEENLKREKLRKLLNEVTEQQEQEEEEEEEEPEAPTDRSASLRSRMERRLESARFRYINEVLYTTSSGEAKRMFQQDPQAFWIYHRGYTAQVQRWPTNPLDAIISDIRQRPASLVVADFGCGDCKIAQSVKNKVHSFDLAAVCDLVTVCDMSKVPLGDSSVDIAVFCLSLMGTNLTDFIAEANRVLKTGGLLKIAEVASRFDNVRSFLTALASQGFKLVSKNRENSHFYSFDFVKTEDASEHIRKSGLQLKPCLYKKR